MSEFLFLYRNGEKLSPEQMQQQMGRWMAWLKELGEKGVLKSAGHPLDRSGKLVSGAKRTVTSLRTPRLRARHRAEANAPARTDHQQPHP